MLPLAQVFVRARQKLGEILSAFEFLDQASLELTVRHMDGVRNPLPDTQTPFYLVVETHGSNEAHDYEKLQVPGSDSSPPSGLMRWLSMPDCVHPAIRAFPFLLLAALAIGLVRRCHD